MAVALPMPLKRSVIALFPYLRRAETFEHYTLAKWVESFTREKNPEAELLWWNHVILVTLHTIKLLELHPCATTPDDTLLSHAPPDIPHLARPESVRRFRALDDACVRPLLASVLMRFSGSDTDTAANLNFARKLPPYVLHVQDIADAVVRHNVTHLAITITSPLPNTGVQDPSAAASTRQCNGCC